MAKLLLIGGFVLVLTTLGFAAANTGIPSAPEHLLVNGQVVTVDYN
jgi:hypothetical protein